MRRLLGLHHPGCPLHLFLVPRLRWFQQGAMVGTLDGVGMSRSWGVFVGCGPLLPSVESQGLSSLSLSLTHSCILGPVHLVSPAGFYMETQGSQKYTTESFQNRISTILFPIYIRELDFISEARVTPHAVASWYDSISLQNKSVRITELFTLSSQQILSLSRY